MTATFVSASPTVYVASGASTLTLTRPGSTVVGDIMLAFLFARFGRFVETYPSGSSSGSFLVFAQDGTHWVTRAGFQTLLYRVVRPDEPSSYTFEFYNDEPAVYGDVTDSFLVGAIAAYRGAELSASVGADNELHVYGGGEPIIYEEEGSGWDGSIVADGNQFDGFSGAGSSQETPFVTAPWYSAVEDQLTILAVSVDWSLPYTSGVGAAAPDPPTNVAITLPAGFTRRTGSDSPHGGLVTIADGLPFSDPAVGLPGTLVGVGTWRDKTFDLYDTAVYELASPTLDTADQVVDGITFSMQALVWVMAVYAGEAGCPPRLAATARTLSERLRLK